MLADSRRLPMKYQISGLKLQQRKKLPLLKQIYCPSLNPKHGEVFPLLLVSRVPVQLLRTGAQMLVSC